MDQLPDELIREIGSRSVDTDFLLSCRRFYTLITEDYRKIDYWRLVARRHFGKLLSTTDPSIARRVVPLISRRIDVAIRQYYLSGYSPRYEDELVSLLTMKGIKLPADSDLNNYPLLYIHDLIGGSESWAARTRQEDKKYYKLLRKVRPEYFSAFVTKYPECLQRTIGLLRSGNVALVTYCLEHGTVVSRRDIMTCINAYSLDMWKLLEGYLTDDDIDMADNSWLSNPKIVVYVGKKYPQYVTLSKAEEYHATRPHILCKLIEEVGLDVKRFLPNRVLDACDSPVILRQLLRHYRLSRQSLIHEIRHRRRTDIMSVLYNPVDFDEVEALDKCRDLASRPVKLLVYGWSSISPASNLADAINRKDSEIFRLLVEKRQTDIEDTIHIDGYFYYLLEIAFLRNFNVDEVVDLGVYNKLFRPSLFVERRYLSRLSALLLRIRIDTRLLEREIQLTKGYPSINQALVSMLS